MLEEVHRQVHHKKLYEQRQSQMLSRSTQAAILSNQNWHYQYVSMILLYAFKSMGCFFAPVTHIVSEQSPSKITLFPFFPGSSN